MLQKIILNCTYVGDQKASYNWGSLFHGAMIELLPDIAADMLHDNTLRPFSQYVHVLAANKLEWHIGLWDNQYAEAIAQAIMPLSTIEIKHKGLKMDIVATERKKQSVRDYFAQFFTNETPCRKYELEFLTPCTHKSSGQYVLFPSTELIIQSLLMRFSAYLEEFTLEDPEAIAQLFAHLKITRYYLRSAQYYLEKTRIPGYMGRITLFIGGPEPLARLAGLLLSFAEYAGVGVKTSLGMGGCRVTQIKPVK